MIVALLSVELFLPTAGSLKDKRVVLRRLKDRLGALNVAVAEVEHQDLWQRAGLGIVTVASSDQVAEQTLATALETIERLEPDLVTRSQVEFIR
ncbi:MAG TPA: DUF503 domain-containing protein [Vicinamibacterales bacterium]|nr:DUF503 domain-containing protein [Vicinamibacterales bacterium]